MTYRPASGEGDLSARSLIPAGLRWRVRCRAHRKSGERCKRYAIAGGWVCMAHGGAAPQVRAAALRRLEEGAARALALRTLGRLQAQRQEGDALTRRVLGLPVDAPLRAADRFAAELIGGRA